MADPAATSRTPRRDPPIPMGEWDKTRPARVRAGDARPLRLRPPAVRRRARARRGTPTARSPSLTGSDDRADGSLVTIGGLVSGLQRKVTKKGDVWAIATVEDLEGAIEVMFFPQTYQQCRDDARRGRRRRRQGPAGPARGRAQAGRDGADACPTCPRGRGGRSSSRCRSRAARRRSWSGSRRCWRTHPGATEVHLRLQAASRTTVLRLDDGLRVNPSPALMGDLKALLGPRLPRLTRAR